MRLKWILGIITCAIVFVIVGGYALLSTYSFNDLKPRAVQAVKDATGRELTLGGNIKLEVGLTPSLVVDNVSFQNSSWGTRPELAKIKRLEMQIALLPLISKNIEIKRFTLIEPDILIETDRSGKSNLAFEISKEASSAQPSRARQNAGTWVLAPVLSQLRIEQGHLTYRDGRTGTTKALSVEKLTASSSDTQSPIQISSQGAYNEKPFELAGTLIPLAALTDSSKAWPLKILFKAAGATLTAEGELKDPLGDRTFSLNIGAHGTSVSDFVNWCGMSEMPQMGPFKMAVRMSEQKNLISLDNLDVDTGTQDMVRLKLKGTIKDIVKQRKMEIQLDLSGQDLAKLNEVMRWGRIPLKGPFRISGNASDSAEKVYRIADLEASFAENDLSTQTRVF